MKVHAEPRGLDRPLDGGQPGASVAVQPIKAGEFQLPGAAFEGGRGRFQALKMSGLFRRGWRWVPCPTYLIRHPSGGDVLVDTGLHPSITARPAENFGRFATWYARPRLEPGGDLAAQLRERGVDPRSISRVVMTHLHYDHASGIAEFPSASFILSREEWDAATTGSRPLMRGYRPEHYDYAFDYRVIDFDGPRIDSYSTFARTFDLFGDGSIRLAFTPGHTLGHMSVIARLRERDFVIAGDAVYTLRQLEEGIQQPRPHDPHLWRRSLQELQIFHRQYPQAVISPGHDPELWATLSDRYE
jgi:glyoxylase-like metal-dependent hydrolase (beta-lactamase superfamily II)